jgi:serine/threonine-protein kinase
MLLVMEYVRGDSVSRLLRAAQLANTRIPPNVVVAIMLNALAGLHAAHEALDEQGVPLGLVHRDVSPQNIMVGVDGVARVLDFGIAKASGRLVATREGEVKGKVMYMSREQLAGEHLTRAADIYAAGIILYEMLTGSRMFAGAEEVAAVSRIVAGDIRLPSQTDGGLAPFDPVVRRAVALYPQDRYPTARDMALDLERICSPASANVVGEWVQRLASERLDLRARLVAEIERSTTRARAALGQLEERHPTSGVVPTSRGMQSAALVGHLPEAMAAPPPPQKSGLGLVTAVVLMVCFVLAGLGLTGIVLSRRPKPIAPPVAVTPAASDTPPPPSAAIEEPPPIVSAAPASASVAAPPPSPPPVWRPKAKPKCDPPYTIDEKGHKHFLPECVGQ